MPLIGERQTIGVFGVPRDEPVAFTDREIEIVRTFADQAVIAIENARLFDEVQAKTRDLTEALQQQTATAEVLKVISRSAFDLDAVLNTLTESRDRSAARRPRCFTYATARCGSFAPSRDAALNFANTRRANPFRSGGETVAGRVLLTGETAHIPDVLADPDYRYGPGPRLAIIARCSAYH